MVTTVGNAADAYLNTLKQGKESGAAPLDGPSFGDLLKETVGDAVAAQRKSEQVSASAVMGKANTTDVLEALNNAEMSLTKVLAIRDRLVQAFNELMRQPI